MKKDFTQSFDGGDWAAAFLERVKTIPGFAEDLDNLRGWFCNAIMRGYDERVAQEEMMTFNKKFKGV